MPSRKRRNILSLFGEIENNEEYTIDLSGKIFKRRSKKITFEKRKTKLLCERMESVRTTNKAIFVGVAAKRILANGKALVLNVLKLNC